MFANTMASTKKSTSDLGPPPMPRYGCWQQIARPTAAACQLGRDYVADDWTEAENRAIVDDYLAMLALDCAGKSYSKTEHRTALIESMGCTRSRGSVERKHQNISAVMLQLGL